MSEYFRDICLSIETDNIKPWLYCIFKMPMSIYYVAELCKMINRQSVIVYYRRRYFNTEGDRFYQINKNVNNCFQSMFNFSFTIFIVYDIFI